MKRLISILMLLVMIFYCQASIAGEVRAKFAWDYGAIGDVAGWTVHYGMQSGAYTQTWNIPLAESIETSPGRWETQQSLVITAPDGAETLYYFVMTAYDEAGNRSGYSNEIFYKADFLAPEAPTSITIIIVIQ